MGVGPAASQALRSGPASPVMRSGPASPVLRSGPTSSGGMSIPASPVTDSDYVNVDPARNTTRRARSRRVAVLMSETGGGHRASAEALRDAMTTMYHSGFELEIVDFCKDIAGFPYSLFPDIYKFLQQWPFLWKLVYGGGSLKIGRFIAEEFAVLLTQEKFKNYFESRSPDLIVSVHPLAQTVSLRGLKKANLEAPPPFVTIVTDLGGAHPTWFSPEVDACFVPSEPVHRMAEDQGLAKGQIMTFGLPVRRAFWGTQSKSKEDFRADLGLHEDRPAVLLVGGGDGVGQIEETTECLANSLRQELGQNGAQIVVVCGKNEKLANSLRERKWALPVFVKGFTQNIGDFMSASDLLITKAGPGTIAEGLIRGLPILLFSYLPGQEEGNVRFVIDNGIGEYRSNPSELAELAAEWLADPEALGELSARALENATPSATLEMAKELWTVMQESDSEKRPIRRLQKEGAKTSRASYATRTPLARFMPKTFAHVVGIFVIFLVLRIFYVIYDARMLIN